MKEISSKGWIGNWKFIVRFDNFFYKSPRENFYNNLTPGIAHTECGKGKNAIQENHFTALQRPKTQFSQENVEHPTLVSPCCSLLTWIKELSN